MRFMGSARPEPVSGCPFWIDADGPLLHNIGQKCLACLLVLIKQRGLIIVGLGSEIDVYWAAMSNCARYFCSASLRKILNVMSL